MDFDNNYNNYSGNGSNFQQENKRMKPAGGNFGYDQGGFLQDQGGSGFDDSSLDHSKARKARVSTVRPVTIKQLHSLAVPEGDDPFILDDVPLGMVSLVGTIVELTEPNATSCSLKLEDGTGLIEIKVWAPENSYSSLKENFAGLKTTQYCRAVCKPHAYSGKFNLKAVDLQTPSGGDAITMHYLTVIKTHLELANKNKIQSHHRPNLTHPGPSFAPTPFGFTPKPNNQNVLDLVIKEIYRINQEGRTFSLSIDKPRFVQNSHLSDAEVDAALLKLNEDGSIFEEGLGQYKAAYSSI